jgi:hypothetical protein
LETRAAQDFGGIARRKNTRRLFVGPYEINTLAVTGVWVRAAATNVLEFTTADAGGAGELLVAPFPRECSDLISRGSTDVDRGVKIVGCEILYRITNSALADIDFTIFKQEYTAAGAAVATAMVATQAFDAGTGVEMATHRASLTIAAANREFATSDRSFYLLIDLDDGTASDVFIAGVVWHYELVEE